MAERTGPAHARPRRSRTQGREPVVVGLVLAAVALAGLGTGAALSRAGGDGDGGDRTTPPASQPPAVTAPTATSRPTGRADSDVERGRTEDLGYLLGARMGEEGLLHVVFDRVQLLRGDAAAEHARRTGGDPEAARDGLVVNENPRTRDMVLAPDVKVLGGVELAASSDLEPVPVQTLLDTIEREGGSVPLELRYDRLGYVVEVRERRFG